MLSSVYGKCRQHVLLFFPNRDTQRESNMLCSVFGKCGQHVLLFSPNRDTQRERAICYVQYMASADNTCCCFLPIEIHTEREREQYAKFSI